MPHSTNQLRKHLKFTLLHKIRQFTLRRKIDTLGENVFIEKNVKILRFPKNVQITLSDIYYCTTLSRFGEIKPYLEGL